MGHLIPAGSGIYKLSRIGIFEKADEETGVEAEAV
jgi:hypothetical protein